jgi:hypothetical protein
LSRKKQSELEITTRAGIKKEMALPRMAMSARTAESKLNSARIPAPSRVRVHRKLSKIIPSPRKRQPEKAQIALDLPELPRNRDPGIESELVDQPGRDGKLKVGARAKLVVTSEPANPRK